MGKQFLSILQIKINFRKLGLNCHNRSMKCYTAHLNKYTCIFANRIQYGKQMYRKKKTGMEERKIFVFHSTEQLQTGQLLQPKPSLL